MRGSLAQTVSSGPAAGVEQRKPRRVRKDVKDADALFERGSARKAEAAYKAIVAKRADPDAYIGLASAAAELEDLPAGLEALRQGAATLTREGDREGALRLMHAAVALAPGDLATHRRLAAALANSGEMAEACAEYRRYIELVLSQGDLRRAALELAYCQETLGEQPGMVPVADRLVAFGGTPLVSLAKAADRVVSRPPRTRRTQSVPVAAEVAPTASRDVPAPGAISDERPAPLASPRTRSLPLPSEVHLRDARTMTHAERLLDDRPVDLLQRIGLPGPRAKVSLTTAQLEAELEALEPIGPPEHAASLATLRAMVLISAQDVRAVVSAIDAARRLLALDKPTAASDVLLELLGAGFTDHEAQRLLIEVDCRLGRRDLAREKCELLGMVYRLDGRLDVAADVERLARII